MPPPPDRERVEHLFILYEKIRTPLEAGMKKNRRGVEGVFDKLHQMDVSL